MHGQQPANLWLQPAYFPCTHLSIPPCPQLLLFPSLPYLWLFPKHEEGSGSLSCPSWKGFHLPPAVISFLLPLWKAAAPAPLHRPASAASLLASNPPASGCIFRRRCPGTVPSLPPRSSLSLCTSTRPSAASFCPPSRRSIHAPFRPLREGRRFAFPPLLPLLFFPHAPALLFLRLPCASAPSIHAFVRLGPPLIRLPSSSFPLSLCVSLGYLRVSQGDPLGESLGENRPPPFGNAGSPGQSPGDRPNLGYPLDSTSTKVEAASQVNRSAQPFIASII